MKRLLAFILAVMPLFAVSVASQTLRLWYNFVPGEGSDDGKYNPTDRQLLYFIDPNGGARNFEAAVVGSPYDSSCTFYALPPAGTAIDYWLASKAQKDVLNDAAGARTSAGTKTYVWSYDGTGDEVYIGARFKYISYGVTFASNGGTGGMPQPSGIVYTNSFALPANRFSKTGYSFQRWSDPRGAFFADGQTVSGPDFGVLDDGTNVVLAAQWTANSYTVTFDGRGASVDPPSKTVTYDSAYGPLPTLARAGYTFAGWFTGASGGTQVAESTIVSVAADRILYAHWTPNAYTITFNKQGGVGGTDSVQATFDAAMPTVTPPTLTGYTFAGYFNQPYPNNTAKYYNANGTSAAAWTWPGDAPLFAVWTVNDYAITFDKQGGVGGTDSAQAVYGAAMPAVTPPTRAGYTFDGYWNPEYSCRYYNADGTSAAAWTWPGDATLLAKWAVNAYTVNFDKQGGSGGTDSVQATFDAAMPAITPPTKAGYTFAGYWNGDYTRKYYNADGSGAGNWDYPDTAWIQAKWTANTYTITFDKQGGGGGTSSVQVQYGAAMPAITPPTLKDYTFVGYFNQPYPNNTAKFYNADGTSAAAWTWPGDAPLFAVWTPDAYTITFDKQGGANGTDSVQVAPGAAMPAITPPTKTGYTFVGYFNQPYPGNTAKFYNADGTGAATWTWPGDAPLFAVWTPDAYTITFDKQGGVGGTDSVQAVYEAAMPAITPPTKTGYTFVGYFNQPYPNNTAKYYNADGTGAAAWTWPGDAPLFAVWTANTYVVSFNPGSGSGTMENQSFVYDVPQAIANCTFDPPSPGAPFWQFSGWSNLTANAFYKPGATVSNLTAVANGVVELVAVWTDVRSDLSVAMECDNLNWISIGNDSCRWDVKHGEGAGYESASCATNAQEGAYLAANVAKSGTLSFWAKAVNASLGVPIRCYQVETSDQTDTTTAIECNLSEDWRRFEIPVDKKSDSGEWWVKIGVYLGGDYDPDFVDMQGYVCIDQMKWTPDSSGDEPTAEDARDISGISFAGGVLSLSFTNADERFNYNLRGTNTLAAPLPLWPVLWTTNGTGTITITPPVVPDEPKFFYYLETTAK